MKKPPGLGVYVFLAIFFLVGLVAIGFGGWNLWRSLECSRWPTVTGVVKSAKMQSSTDNDGGTTYSPKVAYSYEVAGSRFEGDRLAFGVMSSSSGYAAGVLSRYPVGQTVTVHYLPEDPSEAVLETGIHGGTWVCFGVGTAFALAAIMFFQIFRAAGKAQAAGTPPSPDGNVKLDKPPVLMGVLFILMGSPLFFVGATGGGSNGTPNWVIYAAGAMFVSCGLLILSLRLENKIYSTLLKPVIAVAFLAIFHWVSFGPGERIGTSSTPFSTSHAANVRTPFAIFTVIMDLILLAFLVRWLLKRRSK